jgi:hypothetical protein
MGRVREELVASQDAAKGLRVERDGAVEDLGAMRRKCKVLKMKFRHVRRSVSTIASC